MTRLHARQERFSSFENSHLSLLKSDQLNTSGLMNLGSLPWQSTHLFGVFL
jgi:hypothetical protein